MNLSYNRDPQAYRRIHDYLAQLSAPYGVYASLGTPTVDLRESVVPMFTDLPATLLRGESRRVVLGSEGRVITLLGLDCTHHIAPDAAVLRRVAEQAGDDAPLLLLYHSPELMPQAAEAGIDLYLCGHTHGGQVRLPIIGPLLTSSQLGRAMSWVAINSAVPISTSAGVWAWKGSAPPVCVFSLPRKSLW